VYTWSVTGTTSLSIMSFLYDWLRSALNYLGLLNLEAKMLFLGLDNAGKTTLLGALSQDRIKSCLPTLQPNIQEMTLGGLTFRTFDMGGHKCARSLWKDYLVDVDIVVFIVDASDRERLQEAKEELDHLLAMEKINDIPFLVLGNKIDRRDALSEQDLREALGLHFTRSLKDGGKLGEHERPLEVFMCSIANRRGYAEGFRWVSKYVKGH